MDIKLQPRQIGKKNAALLSKIKTLETTVDNLQRELSAYDKLKAGGFYPSQDEPYFILLARDPIAAKLVEAWAYLRMGMASNAMPIFENIVNSAVLKMEPQASHDPQIRSAFKISKRMADFVVGAAKKVL